MARASLVLSAQRPAWSTGSGLNRGEVGSSDRACQFCGLSAAGWQEPLVVNAPCCPLCSLSLHLERGTIDREATLIWLPEMAQGALNILLRNLHLTLRAGGHPSGPSQVSSAGPASEQARSARIAYETLAARGDAAGIRLGTNLPSQLGAALLSLSRAEYDRRAELLGGARLLASGTFYDSGHDIYPSFLASWAGPRTDTTRRSSP